MKKTFFALVLFLFLALFFINSGIIKAQTQNATLALDPSTGSYIIGNTYTLNIRLNTNGNDTAGADIHYLNYNPALIEIQDSVSGTAGAQIQAGSLYTNTVVNSVDTVNGRINFSQTSFGGTTYNGTGILASVTFKALAGGTANLTFNFTAGNTTDTNVASLGQDVLNSVTNGRYTLTVASDTTPPQVTNVASSGINQTAAIITWTTDETSTSQIEYGPTASYGSSSVLNSNLVTAHSASLSGLTAGTTYHYRVKSKDASNNETISNDNTFTTVSADNQAPQISSLAVSGISQTAATITWTTNEGSSTRVEYGATVSYGNSSTLNSSLVTAHSVSLSGLTANTTYHYRVRSKDASNNEAISSDATFTTAATPDTTPPQIMSVASTGISQTAATITWTTNEGSDSITQYGLTTNYGSSATSTTLVTAHSVSLSGLTANTTYHYRVRSKDASNNEAISSDATFTTSAIVTAPPPQSTGGGGGGNYTSSDTTSPSMSEIKVATITQTSATITWKTNEVAVSQIEYGETSTFGSKTDFGNSYLTSHSITILNLKPGITYYYRLINKDSSGNQAISTGASFTTTTSVNSGTPQSAYVSTIKGKVSINSLTGSPLPSTQLILMPGNYKAISLNDGSYQLDNINIGSYSLQISKAGYVSYTAPNVNVSENKITYVDAYLKTQGTGSSAITTPPAPNMPSTSYGSVTESSNFMAYGKNLKGGYFVSSGNVLGDSKDEIITGAGQGFGPQVSIFSGTGEILKSFFADKSSLRGGVRVASGDVDGDGRDEIITGAGPLSLPRVQIFDGAGKSLTPGFLALDSKFKGGIFVACGDINGDGKDEIIVTAGKGGGAHVMAYNKQGQILLNFFAYNQHTFRGGISVSTVDLNGDGVKEIVTVPEVGSTHIQSFTGKGKRINPGFYAFNQNFKGGGSVVGGDINGDGRDEIIVGVGKNGGSQIRILNEKEESIKEDFLAYPKDFKGGVNIGAGDIDGDRKAEILVFPRFEGSPDLRIIKL